MCRVHVCPYGGRVHVVGVSVWWAHPCTGSSDFHPLSQYSTNNTIQVPFFVSIENREEMDKLLAQVGVSSLCKTHRLLTIPEMVGWGRWGEGGGGGGRVGEVGGGWVEVGGGGGDHS